MIEKVDFPNKGIVITDGQKVTVKNGMPGQKVRFMINKKRSGRAEGRLLEVLEKSPLETREPVCNFLSVCYHNSLIGKIYFLNHAFINFAFFHITSIKIAPV